jgi:molecular chaperone GrpE
METENKNIQEELNTAANNTNTENTENVIENINVQTKNSETISEKTDNEINKTDTTTENLDTFTNSNENAEENKTKEEINWEEKYHELNDKFLRLYSEFENYKKRTAKERIEFAKSAAQDILIAILPVIDDFERAIKSNETLNDIEAIKNGLNIIHQKFTNILAKKGLEPMESIGKEFNADLHEAITNAPAPSEEMKGKVIDEVEKGYLLNGKVIRYAKVVVGA